MTKASQAPFGQRWGRRTGTEATKGRVSEPLLHHNRGVMSNPKKSNLVPQVLPAVFEETLL